MDYHELEQLFGAYYHEDFEDVWPAFELYVRDSTDEDLTNLIREIGLFLQSTPRSEVAKETWRLGSYVFLGEDPASYVEWLEEVRRRAASAAHTSSTG